LVCVGGEQARGQLSVPRRARIPEAFAVERAAFEQIRERDRALFT